MKRIAGQYWGIVAACGILFLAAAGCSTIKTLIKPQIPTENIVSGPAPTQTRPATQIEQPTATPTIVYPTATLAPLPSQTVAAPPNPSDYAWTAVVTGLTHPTDLIGTHDGTGRLLILEQPGKIRVVENGKLLPDPMLDITSKVGSEGNEQGLLGIAVHPHFGENGFIYLNYTNKQGNTVIVRYEAVQSGDYVDPASEKILLQVKQPFPNHNGGSMVFGLDGYLYLGLGDGGSGGDPQGNGQNLKTYLGKILRIDVDHGDPYAIPADNPFADGKNGLPEIWAYGLRNPWRFSFDAATGDLYIGDVGQDTWEEIDFLPAGTKGGTNFGWNYREGKHPFKGTPPSGVTLVDPVAEYQHPVGCSVTGGFVYRGKDLPELEGVYLYSDFCNGRVWTLMREASVWTSQEFSRAVPNVSSFGRDDAGELYVLDHENGVVLKLGKK
jgi:glucose/arabinose dehydrogenase